MIESEIYEVLVGQYKQVRYNNTDLSKRGLACLCDIERESSLMVLLAMFDEVEKYRSIGTVEECQNGVEKRVCVKPRVNKYYYFCPNCGTRRSIRQKHNFCHDCGQALDWSEQDVNYYQLRRNGLI